MIDFTVDEATKTYFSGSPCIAFRADTLSRDDTIRIVDWLHDQDSPWIAALWSTGMDDSGDVVSNCTIEFIGEDREGLAALCKLSLDKTG